MTAYEFQSTAYRNASEMCLGIADEWLSAGGANSREEMLDILANTSDEELADECIQAWRLTEVNPDNFSDDNKGPKNWLELRDADREMIVAAFADMRKNLGKYYPAEEEDEE